MKAASRLLAEQTAWAMKRRRVALNLKQSEAAAKAGIAVGTLQKFEQTGSISLERFFKLCYLYKMDNQIIAAVKQRDFWALEEIKRADSKKTVR